MHSETDEKIYAQLRAEFIAETQDGIEVIESALNALSANLVPADAALESIRRHIHTIKGMAEPFGFSFLTTVTHQLEEYLIDRSDLNSVGIRSIQQYCDVMSECLDWTEIPSEVAQKDLVDSLPKSQKPKTPKSEAEALFRSQIITSSKTIYRKISSVMVPMGFNLKHSRSSMRGIEYAVLSKPGLVIVSDVLDGLNGVDIVNALVAMPVTSHIPVIFMTSFEISHPHVEHLPPNIPIIYMGANIKGEILRALTSIEERFLHGKKYCA